MSNQGFLIFLFIWIFSSVLIVYGQGEVMPLTDHERLVKAIQQIDKIEEDLYGRRPSPAIEEKLRDILKELDAIRWEAHGTLRLYACIQSGRTQRLLGSYQQAIIEIQSNPDSYTEADAFFKKQNKRQESPLLPALYELGKVYMAQADSAGDDIEASVDYNVKALKKFYRILKEFPECAFTIRAGADLSVCKSRLERILDCPVPLAGIKLSAQSSAIDEITPPDVVKLLRDKNFEAAIPLLQDVIKKHKGDQRLGGSLLKLAVSYAHLGQEKDVFDTLAQMKKECKSAVQTGEALALTGQIFWQNGKKAVALKIFEMLLDSAPDHPMTGKYSILAGQEYFKIAQECSAGSKDTEKNKKKADEYYGMALSICSRLLKNIPGNQEVTASVHSLSGNVYLEQGQYIPAAKSFAEYCQLESVQGANNLPYMKYLAALCWFNAGLEQKRINSLVLAQEYLDEALKLLIPLTKENLAFDIKEKAFILMARAFDEANKRQPAVKEYEQFVQNFSKSMKIPTVLFRLGVIYYELKENDKSSEIMKRLISQYPYSPEAEKAFFNLARIMYESGDYKKSIETCREMFKHPGGISSQELLWVAEKLSSCGDLSKEGSEIALTAGDLLKKRIKSSAMTNDSVIEELRNSGEKDPFKALWNLVNIRCAQAAYNSGKYDLAISLSEEILQDNASSHYLRAKIIKAQANIALKQFAVARADLSDAAMYALQAGLKDESAQAQCLMGDTYLAEGNHQKPYPGFKVLAYTAMGSTWHEYAVFKAAYCAKQLGKNDEYSLLKKKYQEMFPNGKFIKEINN